MTSIHAKVSAAPEVLFRELSGEAVILNLEDGRYYGLDEVGTRMWTLLGEQDSLEKVVTVLSGEYDADPERLRADLLGWIDQLAAKGLLVVEEPPGLE